MNIEMVRRFREELASAGTISKETPFLLTHLSPHWFPPHSEIAYKLGLEGLTVAYDGMILEL